MKALFKCILANSFDDTQENIKWLVENRYLDYFCTLDGHWYLYYMLKPLAWRGESSTYKNLIRSRHIYEG